MILTVYKYYINIFFYISRTVFYSAVVNRTVVVGLVLSWRRRVW